MNQDSRNTPRRRPTPKKKVKTKRVRLCEECGANLPWHVGTCMAGTKPPPFGAGYS